MGTCFKNTGRSYILVSLYITSGISGWLFGQSTTTGMGLDGSTGLFINPSPENLPTGHMRIGTFNASNVIRGGETNSLPIAFSLGFSKRIEVSGSLSAWPYSLEGNDQLLSLGAKINIINFEGSGLSIDARSQNWERAIKDTGSVQESVMTSRLIGAFPVRRAVVHANLGYAQREIFPENGIAVEYPAGIGVVRSFSDKLQTLAEYQTDNISDHTRSSRWIRGVKWYLIDHLQLAAGILGTRQYQRQDRGFFLNLAFSTASLKAFFRVISSLDLITLPSLEDLDRTDTGADSTVNRAALLSVAPEAEPVLDPELAHLPVPPPLDNLESWRPDKAWFEKYLGVEEVDAELPNPPPFEEIQGAIPTASEDRIRDGVTISPLPGDEQLPQPPPLELFDNPDNQQQD